MSQESQPPVISREDYEAIEAAVMETTRGRWFLSEYARRNRNADTGVLLDAIARLEKRLAPGISDGNTLQLQRELTDMAETLTQTKLDLAHSIVEATGLAAEPAPERVFDDVVQAAEKAGSAVLNAAEHVQEIAWALREGADDGRAIEDLDRQALEIYRASNQNTLTTARVRTIVGVLREMESRLETIVGSWRAELAFVGQPGPSPSQEPRRTSRPQPETVLETAPSRIRDDIVFVDAHRFEDRRKELEPPPIRIGEIPATDRVARAPLPEAPLSKAPLSKAPLPEPPPPAEDNPFSDIDALPDRRKLAVFV